MAVADEMSFNPPKFSKHSHTHFVFLTHRDPSFSMLLLTKKMVIRKQRLASSFARFYQLFYICTRIIQFIWTSSRYHMHSRLSTSCNTLPSVTFSWNLSPVLNVKCIHDFVQENFVLSSKPVAAEKNSDIDDEPKLKLIDFGVAGRQPSRAQDSARHTINTCPCLGIMVTRTNGSLTKNIFCSYPATGKDIRRQVYVDALYLSRSFVGLE